MHYTLYCHSTSTVDDKANERAVSDDDVIVLDSEEGSSQQDDQ